MINNITLSNLVNKKLSRLLRAKWSNNKPKLELNNKILVGTHHKTGTVWMSTIFKRVSNKFGLKFFAKNQENLPEDFDIFLENHSKFNFDKLAVRYKGIHIIRDPRDVIISACFYHTKSKEKWLHIKKQEWGGLTYQEKINSYNSLDDQILFEMENSSFKNILDMVQWDYSNLAFIEIQYEEIILDKDLLLFHKILVFLGFSGKNIPEILNIIYNSSLFSDSFEKPEHIRSGKAGQWQDYFKSKHKTKFVDLYGDALIKLGYENNNNWADS